MRIGCVYMNAHYFDSHPKRIEFAVIEVTSILCGLLEKYPIRSETLYSKFGLVLMNSARVLLRYAACKHLLQ